MNSTEDTGSTPAKTSTSSTPWNQRVATYVNEIAEVAETIDLILDETRIRTVGLKPDEVDASTQQLAAAITQLEAMVERRDQLLRDPDSPKQGLSLSEKLLMSRKIEDARLARRCGEVAEMIATTHHRATALFVCQYHLSELQTDLLNRLAGAVAPQTYGKNGKQPPGNGSLFNEAA